MNPASPATGDRPGPWLVNAQIPPAGEIHIWLAGCTRSATRSGAETVLNEAERRRADQYRFTRDADRYRNAHVALREVLAGYLKRRPAEITYRIATGGKPHLAGGEMQFSLSHSGDLCCIAVAQAELGVDVERHRSDMEFQSLARRFFNANSAQSILENLENPAKVMPMFFDQWTMLEAQLKATGMGLFALDRARPWVECSAITRPAGIRTDLQPVPNHLRQFNPAKGYSGAVASCDAITNVVMCDLPDWPN